MRLWALFAGLVVTLAAAPALAAPSAYDQAFVSTFADACIPGRLSYDATQQAAMAAGWVATDFGADPQLAIIETPSADVAKKLAPLKGRMVYAACAEGIEGAPHYLVLSFADLGPVAVLLGAPFADSQVDMHIASYSWATPEKLPGTRETYLTFVPEISQYKAQTGFSGQVLQFNTTVPPSQESPS